MKVSTEGKVVLNGKCVGGDLDGAKKCQQMYKNETHVGWPAIHSEDGVERLL